MVKNNSTFRFFAPFLSTFLKRSPRRMLQYFYHTGDAAILHFCHLFTFFGCANKKLPNKFSVPKVNYLISPAMILTEIIYWLTMFTRRWKINWLTQYLIYYYYCYLFSIANEKDTWRNTTTPSSNMCVCFISLKSTSHIPHWEFHKNTTINILFVKTERVFTASFFLLSVPFKHPMANILQTE